MRFLPLLLLLAAASAPAAQFYLYDDGTAEFSSTGSSNHVLAVGFQAQAGKLSISGMEFYNFWTVDNHAIDYYLWRDPTNDGNPADAQVVQTMSGTLSSKGWQSVVFPALTSFNEGDWFYVGSYFTDPVFSYFVSGIDTNSGSYSGNSWWIRWATGATADMNSLSGGTIVPVTGGANSPANLLIRANAADPGPTVPEPSTFWLAAGGLGLALARLRRRS